MSSGRKSRSGVSPLSDAGDVESGVVVRERVVAGVVAERPFADPGRLGIDPPLDHDVGLCGNLEVYGGGAHHGNGFSPEETGQEVLVDARRERRRCDVAQRRVPAERDGHGHLFPAPLVFSEMEGGGLVNLPVHGGAPWAQNLNPVHAHVARSSLRVAGNHLR